ncbi:hypothetical protein HOL24_09195 [bacterium]|nr:hypothetical protein [bacterium]
MSYFPILKAPYCTGSTTLYNFSPNNWELVDKCEQTVSLTYIKDDLWYSVALEKLAYQDYKVVKHNDISDLIPDGALALLSLSKEELPRTSEELPVLNCSHTYVPMSRATLGLKSSFTTTVYQGEINPFPSQASLLTFSPFLQFGSGVENYVLLMNLEKLPESRKVVVEIYDAHSKELKKIQSAYSNQINIISLNDMGFNEQSLPVIICREMASIPLYFSSYKCGEILSLEHTHPPASLVVHGNRFGAQKQIKEYWFAQLKK